MFDKIFDIPAHPLYVHAAVVLVPLTAVALICSVAWPAARARLGGIVPVFAVISFIATFFSKEAGEKLYDHQMALYPKTEATKEAISRLEIHAEAADWAFIWCIILLALALLWWLMTTTATFTLVNKLRDNKIMNNEIFRNVIGGLSVIASIISVIVIIRTGHTGAVAVWKN